MGIYKKMLIGEGVHDDVMIAFIDNYWKEHIASPSIREIAAECNTSTSVVRYTLARLVLLAGYQYSGHRARGIIPPWVSKAIEKGRPCQA